MNAIETKELATKMRNIATTLTSDYSRKILEEAADRLEDTEKIAEFYRMKAEKRSKGVVAWLKEECSPKR